MRKTETPWPFSSPVADLQRAVSGIQAGDAGHACDGCRYWSDLIAHKPVGVMYVVAQCLNPNGPKSQTATRGSDTCRAWAVGDLGAVDEPGQDPLRYAVRGW